VARNHRESMMQGGGGNDQVRLRERVSAFAALLDKQSPFEHDVFADRENTLFEHRSHLMSQPVGQLRATRGVWNQLDAESNLSQRHGTDIERLQGLSGDELQHLRLRTRTPELGENVGVE